MDEPQLLALKPELDHFLDRFAPLFGRDENQAHARRFVQGLLHGGERRNAENIAQATSGGPVRPLQAFITTGVAAAGKTWRGPAADGRSENVAPMASLTALGPRWGFR
jgi:hypothetical protein